MARAHRGAMGPQARGEKAGHRARDEDRADRKECRREVEAAAALASAVDHTVVRHPVNSASLWPLCLK